MTTKYEEKKEKKKEKKIARDHTICSCDNLIHAHTTCGYGPISDHICMFTCTRNYLVSSLLYFRPLSRYALYYYIMAENHVADNQTCLPVCSPLCGVCMLKTRLSTCGTGNTLKFLFKNRKKLFFKNRKISGSPQFRFPGDVECSQKIWDDLGENCGSSS